jgi:hypothetical protein
MNQKLWDIQIIIHQELDKSNFNCLTFWRILKSLIINLNSNICVWKKTFFDNLFQFWIHLKLLHEEIGILLGIIINTGNWIANLISSHI